MSWRRLALGSSDQAGSTRRGQPRCPQASARVRRVRNADRYGDSQESTVKPQSSEAPSGPVVTIANGGPEKLLERTTGFEPATLTLAKKGEATSRWFRCKPLASRSAPQVFRRRPLELLETAVLA
jgi:hypothetical protein